MGGIEKAPLLPLPVATRIMERVGMDVVGPLNESNAGNKYMLVISDYATRFAFVLAIPDQKVPTVARAFVMDLVVLTDLGTNFLWKLVATV